MCGNWVEVHLGERNQEARTGRTKVRWGADVEASMYEAFHVGVCPDPKAREPGLDGGGSEKLYKQLVTRGHGTDVATDSPCWNQEEHATSILEHGVIKGYTTNIYCTLNFARSCFKCTIHLVLKTAL